jgi:ankyrin repeat protein
METGNGARFESFLIPIHTTRTRNDNWFAITGNDWTCFHRACWRGASIDIIKSLLDVGGGKELVMMTDSWNRAALQWACYGGASFDVMKMLIDLGGRELVMKQDYNDSTALHYLCFAINKHDNVANKIKLMLQVPGTEVILTEKNDDGETPFDKATAKGASDKIEALLQPRMIKKRTRKCR